MQLAQLRAEIAPLFGMTEDNLRVRQQSLYREPALRKLGMTGRGTELRDRALTATAASSALLMLTAMLGMTRETIGPAVVRLWEAPPVTRSGNPVERCALLGAALTLLLQRPDVRSRLADIAVELNHDVPDLTLVWNRGSRVTFAPFDGPRAWRRRILEIAETGRLDRVSRLPRTTFDKVAALIAAEVPP